MTDERPAVAAPTADQLRLRIISKRMEELAKQDEAKAPHQKELEDFTNDFLTHHVGDEERAMIQNLVMNALNNGKFEAMAYSFPSDLCSDSGRAIINRLDHGPETLPGKAKELYDGYLWIAKPQGFKLKAPIISFPGGMPGDVGSS
jgi:hypothetical protein